jgi:hypothetical protein
MSHADREYLLARAQQERTLAEQASSEVAREVHLRLARKYEVRANIEHVRVRAENDVLGVSDGN